MGEQSQISIIAYMSGDGVMSIVPPRGFIWGEAIEGLESDWIFGGVRVVGDRALIESVAPENLRGEVRGPDLQQSVTDNPTLHNTIHDTISSFIYLSPALLCASVHIAKFKQFTEIISLSEIMISFTCTVMLVSGVVPSNVSTTLKCIISILSINSITIHFKAVNRTSRNFTGLLQSHLKVVCLHVPGREAVEGRPLVYAVGHHQRPVRGHEGARAVQVAPEVHAGHVVGDRLERLKHRMSFCKI